MSVCTHTAVEVDIRFVVGPSHERHIDQKKKEEKEKIRRNEMGSETEVETKANIYIRHLYLHSK